MGHCFGPLIGDAAGVEQGPVLALGRAEPPDGAAVGALGARVILVAAQQIAQLHQRLDALRLGGDQTLQQLERLLLAIELMQRGGDAQLAGEADRRRVVDRRIGIDRRIEVLLVDEHVADQERRLGQVRLQVERQAGIQHGTRAAPFLVQRLRDSPQRVGHAAGRIVERRRQRAPGLELGERAFQDRLIGPLGHLLADQPERAVDVPLVGEQARLRLHQAHRRRTIVRHAVAQDRLGLVQPARLVKQHRAVIDVERAQRFALVKPRQALLHVLLAALAEDRPGVEERHG